MTKKKVNPKPKKPLSHGAGIPISKKVEHVKAQTDTEGHHCHWPGCKELVPPARWGCARCWFKLPKVLRDKIWAAYRPGQEQDKRPSQRYLEVAEEVQEWIKENG